MSTDNSRPWRLTRAMNVTDKGSTTDPARDGALRIAGTYARLGGRPAGRIIVCLEAESGSVLHEVSGAPVAVAHFYENLNAVCKSLRDRYPDAAIVIASAEAPVESERAEELTLSAALATQSAVAYPPSTATFAQAYKSLGAQAILEALDSATPCDKLQLTRSTKAVPGIVPFPVQVEGRTLIRRVMAHISRHTVQSPAAVLAMSLWTLASHAPERFRIAPILAFLSLTRRSGKTSALAVITPLLHRPSVGSDVTAAALCESASRGELPVLDELDQYIERHSGLAAVLNAGHSRAASRVVRKGAAYDVFGFKIVCAIGTLPAPTVDRAIVIPFIRKKESVSIPRYEPVEGDDACALHAMIRTFWLDHATTIPAAVPKPEVDSDRAKDNWGPLLTTAALCGEDILQAALAAAKELTRPEDDNPHILEEFICDVVRIFVNSGKKFIPTEDLKAELCADADRPWETYSRGKPISNRHLATLMRTAKVQPGEQFNDGTKNRRGYWRRDLQQLIDGYSDGRKR